jgi:hypothetical protein
MTAMVPYRRGELGDVEAKRGAVNVLQLAVDGVAADVRIERVDRSTGSSRYALRLAATDSAVTGRLVGELRGGEVVELGTLEVAPGSRGNACFAVTAPRRAPYTSMFLEIRSAGVLLRVEAPQPPRRRPPNPLKTGGACVALGGAVTIGAALLSNGLSHARPVVTAAQTHATRVAAPAAPRPLSPARVVSFAARRDGGAGGETVLASYLAIGDVGSVVLLDHAGKVVASAPFTRRGTTRVPVPASAHAGTLVAQLTVRRAGTDAVASVALPPNAVPQPVAAERVAAAAASFDEGTIVVRGRPLAGRPLELRVAPSTTAMQVELQDDVGAAVAESTIAPGATVATLQLPDVDVATSYFLVLRYARDGGEETVVRSVAVAPAR